MKKFYISLAAVLLMLPTSLVAQETEAEESTGSRRFWQASLPGGSYVVALTTISSVSKHTYVIDGSLKVVEVIVDTTGNSLARFYYIVPVAEDSGSNITGNITARGKEILDKAGSRTGANANNLVAKQYPTTTHAKTVEFRISSEADLDSLLASVRRSWMNGNGKKFTITTN